MPIFDKDLATSEPTFIKECRKWMVGVINKVVRVYISDLADNALPAEWVECLGGPINYICHNVKFKFVKNKWRLEKMYNISATCTTIEKCYDGEHEYVINVEVRLVGEKDLDNYINIIKMPIVSAREKELINNYRKKYNYESIR